MADANGQSKRYDRQLRIWGAQGQARLEACKVVLLTCGPTGSEALKNLVLGGIGSFTIVDGETVSPSDLGNNFMVGPNDVGRPRAKVVTELLQELNPSVRGSYVEEAPEVLLDRNPAFFSEFNLVIATQMRQEDVLRLDEVCRQRKVQLLVVRSYGLIGCVRACVPEHQVIESKPDTQLDDLRLNHPWPELQDFARSFDLATVDNMTHHHIPYAVLLLQAADKWRANNDSLPSTSKQRTAFKELLNSMRCSTNGIPLESENFDEALKAAFHVWSPYTVPSEVRQILDDEKAASQSADTDDFWILVAALKAFVEQEGHGCLPLDGSIPDMHATTELYLRLQRIYREQADKDVAAVQGHVRNILQRVGRHPDAISATTVRLACKNARALRLVRYRPLSDELSGDKHRTATLLQALTTESSPANASFYVLLRAADRFHTQHSRYPGTIDSAVEDDVSALRSLAAQILTERGVSGGGSAPAARRSPDAVTINEDYVTEMVRFGAGELHVMGAFMGGVAAQEAIKLVTGQFVPVAGTLIYNAISCTTSVLEL